MVLLVLVLLLLIGVNVAFRVIYSDFYANSEKTSKIAGISDGLVQQGIDIADGKLLTVGYFGGGKASRVYTSTKDTVSSTTLLNIDGSAYTGHAGGITHSHHYAYIAGGDGLDVFLLSDFTSGREDSHKIGTVKTYNDPAWCTVYGEYLFAGSFSFTGNEKYEPESSEILTTPAGDKNTSVITVFKLDEASPFGINPVPVAAISAGEKNQGCAFYGEGKLILSTSYGLASSKLYFHNISAAEPEGEYTLGAYVVPLYFLDSSTLTHTVTAPPMSEELIIAENKLYIMNESASNKYVFGKFVGGDNLYAYELKDQYFEK